MRSSHAGRGCRAGGRHIDVTPGEVGHKTVRPAPVCGALVEEGQQGAIRDLFPPHLQPAAAVRIPGQRGGEVGGEHDGQWSPNVAQPGQGVIVRRPLFYEMRHSEPGAPVLCREPPDGGWVSPPCVYHHGSEHVGGEGVEAPVVHSRQAQPMFVLHAEFPVRLQLESQVGDGVRRRYPVPRVFEVGAEAQVQACDPLYVAMVHWRGLTSMPIILRYAATASTPS